MATTEVKAEERVVQVEEVREEPDEMNKLLTDIVKRSQDYVEKTIKRLDIAAEKLQEFDEMKDTKREAYDKKKAALEAEFKEDMDKINEERNGYINEVHNMVNLANLPLTEKQKNKLQDKLNSIKSMVDTKPGSVVNENMSYASVLGKSSTSSTPRKLSREVVDSMTALTKTLWQIAKKCCFPAYVDHNDINKIVTQNIPDELIQGKEFHIFLNKIASNGEATGNFICPKDATNASDFWTFINIFCHITSTRKSNKNNEISRCRDPFDFDIFVVGNRVFMFTKSNIYVNKEIYLLKNLNGKSNPLQKLVLMLIDKVRESLF